MYGIINQSIQELIIKEFGEETWLKIISKCKLGVAEFQNHEIYDDNDTYALAGAAAKILSIEVSAVLKLFGEFWITDISLKKYPALMTSRGLELKEFIRNLPNFHNRIYLSYPKLIAPEFKITEDENETIWVEYYSNRPGLTMETTGKTHFNLKSKLYNLSTSGLYNGPTFLKSLIFLLLSNFEKSSLNCLKRSINKCISSITTLVL
jgi:hypothetical protein